MKRDIKKRRREVLNANLFSGLFVKEASQVRNVFENCAQNDLKHVPLKKINNGIPAVFPTCSLCPAKLSTRTSFI